jgi:hypothetical protein
MMIVNIIKNIATIKDYNKYKKVHEQTKAPENRFQNSIQLIQP